MASGSRERLLEAGWRLLQETGDLAALQMQGVVARAKVVPGAAGNLTDLTSGAFYGHWGNLDAYRQDLLTYAFSQARSPQSARIRDSIHDLLIGPTGPQVPLLELVRRYSAEERQVLAADHGFRLWVSLWANRSTEAGVPGAIQVGYHEIDHRWADLYARVLRAYGLEFRPPFDEHRLATVLTALLEGLVLRGEVDGAAVPSDLSAADGSSGAWDLFGVTIAALLPVVTRSAGDDRDAWSAAEELLGGRQPARSI